MALEGNYVDSHGQSEIGFAITRLLDFDLLARIKQISRSTRSSSTSPIAATPTPIRA
jgi:TnpA family transposase